MIKNFFLVAYRNLAKNKATAILNISGLAIGVTVCLVIGIWLQRELSFDKFHPDGKQIFRIANTFKSESESFSQAPSGPAFGAHLTKELPAVQATCRVFIDGFKVKRIMRRLLRIMQHSLTAISLAFLDLSFLKETPNRYCSRPT